MLMQGVFFIVHSVVDLLSAVFLLRFLMQWARVPFRNPLGQFVIAATDWAVLPGRKVLPGWWGLDVASVFPAWLSQWLFLVLSLTLGGLGSGLEPAMLGTFALLGLLECLRVALYLVFGVVLITAIMSWVNPYAPMAAALNALARPFLAPLQRVIPPLGGVDLSPLVLILLIQLLQMFLVSLRLLLI